MGPSSKTHQRGVQNGRKSRDYPDYQYHKLEPEEEHCVSLHKNKSHKLP